MKYLILLGDGMADEPVEELGGRTPLDVANTPYMDKLASRGEFGLVRTVKPGFPPGSDVANMTVLGLDPAEYYTGRAPVEALSLGVKLDARDTALRINLVTISPRGETLIMEDYCADHISTEEAHELIQALKEGFASENNVTIYPGIEYRHLMVIRDMETATLQTTPPHDIIGEDIATHWPGDERLCRFIRRSMEILKDHPVNLRRRKEGKREATAFWPWGQGKAMVAPTLEDEFGIRGAMISAVDLLRGLGIVRNMDIIHVPGATGWIDTNYLGKAKAALEALHDVDLVYVHVEAPDEAGHGGLVREKIKAIEDFDQMVVGHILTQIESMDTPFRVLFLPDHPTPVAKRTHTSDPVPYVIYDSEHRSKQSCYFTESAAHDTGVFIEEGHTLLSRLLKKD